VSGTYSLCGTDQTTWNIWTAPKAGPVPTSLARSTLNTSTRHGFMILMTTYSRSETNYLLSLYRHRPVTYVFPTLQVGILGLRINQPQGPREANPLGYINRGYTNQPATILCIFTFWILGRMFESDWLRIAGHQCKTHGVPNPDSVENFLFSSSRPDLVPTEPPIQ
jgi:hypothetical protein